MIVTGYTMSKPINPNEEQYWSAKKMSLCIAFIEKNNIYLCCDSRSSVPDDDSGVNAFTKKQNKSHPVNDNYRKIIRLPLEKRNIIGFSTGMNLFNGKTISEIVKSIEYHPDESTLKCMSKILERILEYNCETNVDLFEYVGENVMWVSGHVNYENIDIAVRIYKTNKSDTEYVYSGPDWAKQLLSTNPFSSYENEERKISEITAIFENAKAISSKLENTIGGPIHIGKLTPNGFVWLQNGYEL